MGSQTNRLPDMRPEPQRRFIPVQDYPVRPPVLSRHFLHDGEGPVGRAVIRKDDFNRPFIILPEYAPDGIPDAALLIMPGQDNADGRESRRIHEKKCRKGSEKNERNIALPRLHIRHHVHTGFQIRGQGLIFTPRNLCCADVLSSRISPLAGGNPKPVKQDERFCFPLLLPTHTFFHKQLFFRIIELLEPDPAGIPPHPTGSMRSWDNSLFIHAES